MKSISVSIVGRPSSGKSTLINTICEMKVSITSPTPQTTRNKIKGIYTDSRGQIVFVDTPGFHLSDKEVNKRMREITIESLSECDVLLYLLDGKRSAKKEEETLAELVKKAKVPVVAAVNKKDILSEDEIKDAEFFIRKTLSLEPCFISAKNDEGIDDLLIKIFSLGPEGELMYDESQYTDQNLEFRISEIIREKTINLLKDEMPHVIFVEIEDIEYSEEEGSVWIRAVINTEREGQKGIVVGKGGENIKKIRKESFKEIKRIFPDSKLQLDLRVKSQSKWRNNQAVLDRIFKKNS
ncbi:MAG TPA: GTPase Era [Candidatus Ornithospirochaeta avicola]|uniref:GTPase Era n=1 Tax=Candidatus Ornithospirochaeta avicola TaxID=2840896 RepID=A0A9D1PRT5_9SPIO|nr:GTPase Era [Candidatus Ornithospirochaeta avicola]